MDCLDRDHNEILEQRRIITKEKSAAIVALDMPLLDTPKKQGTYLGSDYGYRSAFAQLRSPRSALHPPLGGKI